jgi:3-hydroxy-5-methyl-1-naphthoate 3-O-methyltransferase
MIVTQCKGPEESVEPFRYHVYACDQQKPGGAPCCRAKGSGSTLDALRKEIGARKLEDQVQVTACESLGLCERGPNLVVYPGGIWYSGVSPEDIPELVESHFVQGTVLERLANMDAPALVAEIRENRSRALEAQRRKDELGVVPDPVRQVLHGFQEARILITALELNLFSATAEGATAEEAAGRLQTEKRATELLLDALTALKYLSKEDGVYRNTQLSGRFFADGSPDTARQALLHYSNLWKNWSALTEVVRGGGGGRRPAAGNSGEEGFTGPFIAAMDKYAVLRTPVLVAVSKEWQVGRMLDVGGGSGAYSIALAQAKPELEAEVLDLAGVVPITRSYIERAGLAGRVKARAGDLLTDPLGECFDLVLISSVCHMLGEEQNRDLVKRAFGATSPGGHIIIQDFLLDRDKTSPAPAAVFSINMLVSTENGRNYSLDEYRGWLEEAGYTNLERLRLPADTELLVAERPERV